MPEGPSILILREQAAAFAGQTVRRVEGNTSIDKERLLGQPIVSVRSWGKHFLLEMPDFTLRIHFLLFGSYRINERKDAPVRLGLGFDAGELNVYTCSVKFIEGPLDDAYDWKADVLSDAWDPALALKRLRAQPDTLVCDALLDQDLFAGVGNIIKNEVLYRIRVHPLSTIGALPAPNLRELLKEARQYSFDFLAWKKAFVLKQHWLAHRKTLCTRCNVPLARGKLGTHMRQSYFCDLCQVQYGAPATASDAGATDAEAFTKVAQPRRRKGAVQATEPSQHKR